MKNKIFIMVAVLLFNLLILSCDENGSETKPPKYADFSGATALFTGSSQGRSARGINIQDNTLYKVNSAGDIEPVVFTDEDGNVVKAIVDQHNIYNISKNFICFQLHTNDNSYYILAENSSGRLFILSSHSNYGRVSEMLGTRNIVYNWDNIVYKLNLDTLEAIPLNNPEVDPIWGSISDNLGIFAIPQSDNSIIVNSGKGNPWVWYKLDLDGIKPPQKLTDNTIYGYTFSTSGFHFSSSIVTILSGKLPIFSPHGNFYSFEIILSNSSIIPSSIITPVNNDIKVFLNGEFVETLNGAIISSNNEMLDIDVKYGYFMNDMYIYKSGLLLLKQNNDGSLNYEYQSKDLEFLFEEGADFHYKNGTVYCLKGDTFMKANPIIDNGYTTIYTSLNTVAKSWMIDENIYFSAYNTATNISTYVIKKGETIPTEISTSEMEIIKVIELTF